MNFGIKQSVLRSAINRWTISAIATFQSGPPFTVLSGRDNNLDGNNTDRANLTGDPYLNPNRSRSAVTAKWFNAVAFAPNATGKDGTSGRNIINAPGLKNFDLGIFRNFKIPTA